MTRRSTVAVVGAGMAGAACTAVLRDAGLQVELFERGRAPGGRLASPELFGRRVDLGAAYFTVSDDGFADQVGRWERAGLARPWTDTLDVYAATDSGFGRGTPTSGPTRWGTSSGTRSLVRDLLDGHQAAAVGAVSDGPSVDGTSFDAVVLAMPDPQALRILQPGCRSAVELELVALEYEPSLAVAARWADRAWPMRDAAFVNDHPVLSFLADDGSRRGDGAPVLVAHTTAGFARSHLDEPERAVEPVLDAVSALLGIGAPAEHHVHRWGFAKPVGSHRQACLQTGGGIVVAGDAWCEAGSPRVESAWLSGRAAAQAVLEVLGA